MEWTEEEEVARAYCESTPALRAALDFLADRPGREVSCLELARAVYPRRDRIAGGLEVKAKRLLRTYPAPWWRPFR